MVFDRQVTVEAIICERHAQWLVIISASFLPEIDCCFITSGEIMLFM